MSKENGGRECKPGDRGDASGMGAARSLASGGNAGKLKTECSKGYESVTVGWAGNVKR